MHQSRRGRGKRCPTLLAVTSGAMRRHDKTELEFFQLMVLIGVPFVWVVIRTVLALLGA